MPVPVKNDPFRHPGTIAKSGSRLRKVGILVAALTLSFSALRAIDDPPKSSVKSGSAVLWTEPTDITSRNLYYGIGGKDHEPHAPYTFVKEDLEGTNPKFVVADADGTKWKVKLGLEARSETAAARLVWAAGYYTPEDYFVADMQISAMPARLHRGEKLVGPDGTVHNVRVKREPKGEKKLDIWSWKDNPFNGTRELNGLKTMMALINNWDLKDVNNAIFKDGSQDIYMVSDLGASFGSAGRSWPRDRAKDNIETYTDSPFITRTGPDSVDFAVPGRPRFVYMVDPKEYRQRVHLEDIGKNIPRADAKWMGNLLAQLAPDQIRDAFRAAGFSANEVDTFSQVLRERISVLTRL